MKNGSHLAAALAAALLIVLAACGSAEPAPAADPAEEPPAAETAVPAPAETPEETAPETPAAALRHAEISVADYGTIKLELDAETAPITVANFVKLAESGFYDGLTFHRIMDGFMIQGGDPLGNGTGGSGENIPGEFAANGVENSISHVKGVISMARAAVDNPYTGVKAYDSASSQFFIMVADYPGLDGQYAAFGRVTEGIEIVEQIARDARPVDSNGTILPEDQPVITGVVITD